MVIYVHGYMRLSAQQREIVRARQEEQARKDREILFPAFRRILEEAEREHA
jgi:hypothetical protein